jgi:hypothetical protein
MRAHYEWAAPGAVLDEQTGRLHIGMTRGNGSVEKEVR